MHDFVGASLRILATAVATLAVVAFIIYLILLGGSHVYASGSSNIDSPAWSLVYQDLVSYGLPGLSSYGTNNVHELNAGHALRNIVFIASSAALVLLAPLIVLATVIWQGVFFEKFWAFLFVSLSSVVIIILFVIVTWFELLFQTSTTAYTLLWIFIGLPAILLGFGGGTTPYVIVIIIIARE